MTYRAVLLRIFDQFVREIGVSNEEMIYALRQDMEGNAHKVANEAKCDKFTGPLVDDLTAMLNDAPSR
jgi:hypothetical protein